ncbi:unnamed protein product [Rotaria sordida]|uniref:Uncharacterized protein n=1 Tax=Rotaria sordida TaxID=392033 RepID=A0A818I8U5_9BILA|nr:unnamed protein product [Rotaria sordida]
MASAGFYYTSIGDTVRCDTCELEVSGWALDMKPFAIHAQRSPKCAFFRSILFDDMTPKTLTINLREMNSALMNDEKSSKHQKIEATQVICQPHRFIEIDKIKQIRKRTFSHWSQRTSPSSQQMIKAGFFNCNVDDCVICLCCNLICQKWTPHTDDPCQIHKTLSPKCPYVISMLENQSISSVLIINEQVMIDIPIVTTNNNTCLSNKIVDPAICHTNYIEIPMRHASFATWSNENLPSVDDLVKAGFFCTGNTIIVTCFYCNGSLQNFGANENPIVEHIRWFPHCAFAKELCSPELYQEIQQVEGRHDNDEDDEVTFSSHIRNRLDLSISQNLIAQGFHLSIIKRCYKDQFDLKHDDFADDSDLLVACMILQKQIERIDNKKEKIIIPNIKMNEIRLREQTGICSSTYI